MNADQVSAILSLVRAPRATPATLEARLLLLEDEQEVTDLLLRYAWLCDARRWDEIWALYTDDFEREITGAEDENVQGIASVKARYSPLLVSDEQRRAGGEPPPYNIRQVVAPPFVRIAADGETAGALAAYDLVTAHGLRPGAPGVTRRVVYLWQLRKLTGGGWRFSGLVVLSGEDGLAELPVEDRAARG